MLSLLEGTLVTYVFNYQNGLSEQENEINFLRKMLKENEAKEEDLGLVHLYKTALRIALARRRWENNTIHSKESFSQNFRLGYHQKKVMRIYCDSECWFSSPGNYACALHNVLARIPRKTAEIEW